MFITFGEVGFKTIDVYMIFVLGMVQGFFVLSYGITLASQGKKLQTMANNFQVKNVCYL
jgi:hypothetical protein